jgi:hypothetical protein
MHPYEAPEGFIPEPTPRRYATAEDLTRNRASINEEDYELPEVGWIRIRAISRSEFLAAQKRYGDDMGAQERFILSRAVIVPTVTEAIAGQWQEASGIQEINKLATKINEMSGLGKGADKSGVPEA